MEGETPVRIVKVTSNDHQPMVYLPRVLVAYGYRKGARILVKLDRKGRVVLELLPELKG